MLFVACPLQSGYISPAAGLVSWARAQVRQLANRQINVALQEITKLVADCQQSEPTKKLNEEWLNALF